MCVPAAETIEAELPASDIGSLFLLAVASDVVAVAPEWAGVAAASRGIAADRFPAWASTSISEATEMVVTAVAAGSGGFPAGSADDLCTGSVTATAPAEVAVPGSDFAVLLALIAGRASDCPKTLLGSAVG